MFFALLLSCTAEKSAFTDDSAATTDSQTDSETDTDTDSDTDTDTDSDTDTGTGGLTDARNNMDRSVGNCQQLQGKDAVGGNSYFWGEYLGNKTDGWQGTEKFYFYANDTAKAAGLSDCEFTWSSTAVVGDPGKCTGCDLAITVTATVATSTCDPKIFEDTDFSTTYGIQRKGDGSADWFYASSGKPLATGYHQDDNVNFLTAASCRWF